MKVITEVYTELESLLPPTDEHRLLPVLQWFCRLSLDDFPGPWKIALVKIQRVLLQLIRLSWKADCRSL